ncbi:replication protein A 70 kDa DNA-binding subunit B-like [Silene latifolia]|uniref:replication protein A 70 kDa DNA-binding subunit B-like n=1 Tax=Silene latifolia TaxID=37657 RepID=UPI003D77AA80
MIDAEIPEVRDFIKRMGSGCRTSVTLTHLSSHSDTIADELLEPATRRTIDEIRESQEEGYYVTLATVKGFDTKYKWFIESCKTCKSAVELDDKGKWVCNAKCEGYAKFVVLRYKVRVNVVDHTGNATFILFDSQVSNLIQQSAKDLRDNQLQHGDPDAYPSELDALLDRKFIFRIKVHPKYNLTKGWDSYSVNKLSEDPVLIEKYIGTCKTMPVRFRK